jgi:hypothetical protein
MGLTGAFCLAVAFAQNAQQAPGPAAISVSGDIAAPLTLTGEDLASMPREKAKIPEQDGTEVEYEGVPLREILRKAGAPVGKLRGKALTTYVVAKAHDGYQVVFTLGEIDPVYGNQQILVADRRDGKGLMGAQGPFRLVCPQDRAGGRSVRMIESLELVRLQK